MSESQMPAEDNKIIVQRFWEEVVNQGNLDVVDELFASDCVVHDPNYDGANGPAGVKEYVDRIRTAFPDVHVTLDTQIEAEGDHVLTRWTGTGTYTGPVKGSSIPHEPTGEYVEISGMSISRVVASHIEEAWLVMEPIEFEPPGPPGLVDWWCTKFPKLC